MSSRFSLALLSAILLSLPFHFPAFFPLAWIAFLPLFWLVGKARRSREAFFSGWLSGWLANLLGFYWLVYTIRVFGGFSYPVSALIFLVFASLEALQFALFAFLIYRFGFGPLSVFAALYWVALEYGFPHLFPWYLANTQSSFLPLIQSADLVGPFGTSFLLMWMNTTVYTIFFSPRREDRGPLLTAGLLSLLISAALIYGHLRLASVSSDMRAAPTVSLAAVQGNIDIQVKWDPDQWKNNLRAYRELSKKAQGVKVMIWPETAVEEWLPEELSLLPPEWLPELQSETAYFIFGVRSFRGNLGGPDFKAFNTAVLTDAQGRVLDRYHKQALLAFGEYIPFSSMLSRLPGIPPIEGFTAGDGPHTLDLPGGIRIAPLICYEDLMPDLSRRFVAEEKANLLVNLTNDAWYGRTTAPWQHAWLAQWRAIETRRSLVRVTNTGLTTVVNARGEMVQTLPIFVPDVLTADVELLDGETLYVRFGDWFAWLAVALLLVFLLWRVRTSALN